MPYVQEAGGVAVGNKVKFLGFVDAEVDPKIYGISVGDIGTVTKAFDTLGYEPDYDVDFPNQDRNTFPADMILKPGEFEVVPDESR